MTFKNARSCCLALALGVFGALASSAVSENAEAQSRSSTFGIGGMVGEPTGLSMKLRASRGFAVDFGVGFGNWGPGRLQLHADFLGAINLTEHDRAGMDLYFGAGPRLAFAGYNRGRWDADGDDGDLWIGVRGAIGLDWEFTRRRLDVFVELAPTIWIVQGLYFDSGAAVGARFWL